MFQIQMATGPSHQMRDNRLDKSEEKSHTSNFYYINFSVDNLELAMDNPAGLGVNFEIYLEDNVKTDQKEGMYQ